MSILWTVAVEEREYIVEAPDASRARTKAIELYWGETNGLLSKTFLRETSCRVKKHEDKRYKFLVEEEAPSILQQERIRKLEADIREEIVKKEKVNPTKW